MTDTGFFSGLLRLTLRDTPLTGLRWAGPPPGEEEEHKQSVLPVYTSIIHRITTTHTYNKMGDKPGLPFTHHLLEPGLDWSFWMESKGILAPSEGHLFESLAFEFK